MNERVEAVVHNHGSEDGDGLSCREYRTPDGHLRGRCLDAEALEGSGDE